MELLYLLSEQVYVSARSQGQRAILIRIPLNNLEATQANGTGRA
jgi:hypothetical protein